MKRKEAIKWVDDRMCWGRGTFTANHLPNIDECWEAGRMAIEALQIELVRCKDCKHREHCHETIAHTKEHDGFREHWSEPIEWCSRGERKGYGDTTKESE